MELIEEITSVSRGAEFYRVDLHIHSYGTGGSYDVKDSNMTPEKIIDTAISENLHVISITDHNAIGNVQMALNHAQGKNILVIPGVELSTSQGHLLVYFREWQELESFLGKLDISADRKSCHCTIPQCLNLAGQFNGIGIAAHIDSDQGFDVVNPKYDSFKTEILKCPNLLGLEIADSKNGSLYSDSDNNQNRKQLLKQRKEHLGFYDAYDLAKVMFSDAHSISALGKNAKGARKLTRLKMENLSFNACRIALHDAAARVRIEELIPNDIPHFVGIKLEGGFLKGQVIHFSRNLTCIIGGRGSGKSTLIESLRAASGNSARESLLDSEVWPDRISLIYRDKVGNQFILTRNKSEDVANQTDPVDGTTFIPIESYGQGETAETIQHCDKDPSVLLKFLDSFVDINSSKTRDREICDQLLTNQTLIERLSIEVNTIPDIEKAKKIADAQLKTLKEKEATKVVSLEEKLAKERVFRRELVENLQNLLKSVKESLSNENLASLILNLDGASLAVGKEQFQQVKTIVEGLLAKIKKISGDVDKECQTVIAAIKTQLAEWGKKETEAQAEIEKIRKELETRGIKLDIAYIRKITKDVSDFEFKIKNLTAKKVELIKAQQERKKLIEERIEIKSKEFAIRTAFARVITQNLRSTVVDYSVTVKYYEGVFSPNLEDMLISALNWRTSRVPKAKIIASKFSPLQLIDIVQNKKVDSIKNLKDFDGSPIFTASDAQSIIEVLKTPATIFSLERCSFDDKPEIIITREVTKPNGEKGFVSRDFSKLSLGQQQSLLLSILLFSKSDYPLIIDQPEDNLDSEFIYKTFVSTLRIIKEKRQVIVVTHNANIAVLGDSELIVPLRASNEFAVVRDRGSIDTTATKTIACKILEGSEEAFKKRAAMYNFRVA